MYLFWLSTWAAKFLQGGKLRGGGLLNSVFNVWPVLFAIATVVAASVFVHKQVRTVTWFAAATFWLNPAMLLHTPVLGYVDSVFAFFGLCSLILLYQKRFNESVLFLTLSCLTKPQGVLILPVVLVVILAERDRGLWGRLSLRFVLFGLLPFIPFILAGRVLTAFYGSLELANMYVLSAQQTNVWWIVSWLLPAISRKSFTALRSEVTMCSLEQFRNVLILDPRLIAMLLLGAFVAFNLFFLWKELQKGNRLAIFWAAALNFYGFTMLSLYPHENHLYPFFVYTLPLLFFQRRVFLRLFLVLSIIFALNNYFFQGLGRGMTATAFALRFSPGFDLTVVLACFNLVIFVWIIRAPHWYFDITIPTSSSAGRPSGWVAQPSSTPAAAGGTS
jgi:hypothetical protein